MDRKFHLLESFTADGSDGCAYKVCVYEHLARDLTIVDAEERWVPTGTAEYRTGEGALIDVRSDGAMQIARSGVALHPSA